MPIPNIQHRTQNDKQNQNKKKTLIWSLKRFNEIVLLLDENQKKLLKKDELFLVALVSIKYVKEVYEELVGIVGIIESVESVEKALK